jgi:hypothetical protein
MNTTQTSFGAKQIVIILLTVITAFVHLSLAFFAFGLGDMTTTVMFALNGLGYLALLAAYYLPLQFFQRYHHLLRWALIAFAAVTVLAWAVMGTRSTLAYVDKLVELALIVLLFTDKNRS